MKIRPASQIADMAGGRLIGEDVEVGPDVVLDSRQDTPGALFIAIDGERVDGHDYAGVAAERGAVAALVSRPVDAPLAQILVDDVPAALSRYARRIADQALASGLVSVALTGSSGKTSTKDMLAQILEPVGPTVAPRGSFNSKLGLPVTVTAVDETTRFLVAEMGASKIGHIAWLCTIAQPTVAAVLNVGHAHLGEFGSRANIAQAKGEIVEALPADGWAVLNADDPLVATMAPRTSAQLAWFSASGRPPSDAQCWVGASHVATDELDRASFRLVGCTPRGSFDEPVAMRTLGLHQVANACAAAALAICAGATPQQAADGLNQAVARSAWRMEPRLLGDGSLLLNDAYNANPDSVAAAISSLERLAQARPGTRSVAVLGDMLELGDAAAEAHQTIGRQAAQTGAVVVGVGDYASQIVAGARLAGGEGHALSQANVADWLGSESFGVLLVKGSRGVGLESIVNQLVAARGEETL